jgi:uncharacterized protein
VTQPIPAMAAPSLTDLLCTRCALCCDGTLFAEVELRGRVEANTLEILGLEVEDGETSRGLLIQPCRALQGTRCGIYAHRPKCCRSFECRLLADVRSGDLGVGPARRRIAATRRRIGRLEVLLAGLGGRDAALPLGEACAEALAKGPGTPAMERRRAATARAWSVVERSIRRWFLPANPRVHGSSAGGP